MLECPRCYTKIADDDRPPPWCPHCGTDLKTIRAARAAPAAPISPGEAPVPGQKFDAETVKSMVEDIVGPDPSKGPPVSRSYVHRRCSGTTKLSGDDYVLLECPFRPVESTICAKCKDYFPLDDFTWADTGEKISAYRNRVYYSVGFWRRIYLAVFCNAYQGALNLHLDRKGRPLHPQS